MKAASRKRPRRVAKDDGPDPIDVFVGKRVRERRQRENLSQSAVADHLDVTLQSVQKYEAARHRISASTLYRLGEALGVAPGYFFKGYISSPPKAGIKRKRKAKR
jgi:transcriptional regulator with XRE-family HTH domain